MTKNELLKDEDVALLLKTGPKQKDFTRKVLQEVGIPFQGFGKVVSGQTRPFVEIYDRDAYKGAHRKWEQYWQWKRNRNPERAILEEKYGFDTKHACHLIRLLRMGKEILQYGDCFVDRRDRDGDHLLKIRKGHFSYGEIVQESEKLMGEIEELETTTTLPKRADVKAIEKVMTDMYFSYWKSLKFALMRQPNYRKLDIKGLLEEGGR